MNNRAGILYTQLTALEKRAQFLEINVEKALDAFLKVPEAKQTPAAEQRIILKLWQLDDLQDQMDAITDELKENGWWASKIAGDAKYIYRAPKIKKVAPPKKKERKPEKVYTTKTTAEQKKEAAAEARRKRVEAREEKKALAAQEKAARAAERAQKAAERVEKASRPKPVKVTKINPTPKPKPRVTKQPKPRVERVPKVKVEKIPKPRRPKECRELFLTKKKIDSTLARIDRLDAQIEAERETLLKRLEERQAKIVEVANIPAEQMGHQKRRSARLGLEQAQKKLDELPQRKAERLAALNEQLKEAREEMHRLTEIEDAVYKELLEAAGYC